MKEALYFAEDLICFSVYGALLAYFLEGMLNKRFAAWERAGRNVCKTEFFMALQFCVVRMAFSWLPYMKRLMYGQDMIVVSSRQSLIPVAVSLAVSLTAGMALYRGGRMQLLSLTTAFYALMELARFFLYPAAVGSMNFLAGHITEQFIENAELDLERFGTYMGFLEIAWNMVISAGNVAILTFSVRRYKKELKRNAGGLKSQEAAILFVPGLMGLLFTVMMRCILFYYDKGGRSEDMVFSLVNSYPELNAMIPCISFLCIVSVWLSARMLAHISLEHEKRRQAELYRSQAEELGAHVRDMESVYIQIRGMKHDMKNYIADVQGLLAQMAAGDEKAGEEVQRYADSMQESLERLDMQCATANPVTDVILGRYLRMARQKKIAFSSRFLYPKHLGIDVFDISVILNNGLDNAMEACEEEESPSVALNAVQKGNMFLISIENTFHGVLRFWDGLPVSSKSGEGHGLGLKNIRGCAEKYYGRVDIKAQEGRFCLTVMLQGRCPQGSRQGQIRREGA